MGHPRWTKPPLILGMVFMADLHTPEVLQPGEQPLHVPPVFVPPQWPAILRLGSVALGPMRSDQLNPLRDQARVDVGRYRRLYPRSDVLVEYRQNAWRELLQQG